MFSLLNVKWGRGRVSLWIRHVTIFFFEDGLNLVYFYQSYLFVIIVHLIQTKNFISCVLKLFLFVVLKYTIESFHFLYFSLQRVKNVINPCSNYLIFWQNSWEPFNRNKFKVIIFTLSLHAGYIEKLSFD